MESKTPNFKAGKMDNVINSDVYKFIVSHNYTLVNWVHSDLVFINNSFRD